MEATTSPSQKPNSLLELLCGTPELEGCIHVQNGAKSSSENFGPWNLRCRPKPLCILEVETKEQVSIAVKLAAGCGVAVQARSGGHSYGSHSLGGFDGSLIIDLRKMKQIRVFPEDGWKAHIEGGALLGEVTEALYAQGKRAIAHGTCPAVGIGGHATIGGQGPLSRLWGLTLDHVLAVEAVLADGSARLIDKEHDPDLFWAIRGAGPSFAIVTKFIFETHPAITESEYYILQCTVGSAATLSGAFQDWQSYLLKPATQADRLFNSVCTFTADKFVVRGSRLQGPGPHADQLSSMMDVHFGPHFEIKQTWKLDWIAHAEQWAQDEIFNFFGSRPSSQYLKSMIVTKDQPLTTTATEAMFEYFHTHKHELDFGLTWFVLADYQQGKIADHAITETSYAHRGALYTLAAYVIDPSARQPFPTSAVNFLKGWRDTMLGSTPGVNFGSYPGYIDPEISPSGSGLAYWGGNYERLTALKQRYDPVNVFRNPQSVQPSKDLAATT